MRRWNGANAGIIQLHAGLRVHNGSMDEQAQSCGDVELLRLRRRHELLCPVLNERQRRLWAASEAISYGHGGIKRVSLAIGMASSTISLGIAELKEMPESQSVPHPQDQRVRRPGGGRKALTETDPTLLQDLESLVAPATRGDPESPLCWTSKSTYNLAEELRKQGHSVSPRTVATLLLQQGYTLQSNRKIREGASHPDRDEQFQHIHQKTIEFQAQKQPVISVDAKKKELVGNFYNAGAEWHPKESPPAVNTHDFPDKELGKVTPYGVYDITRNEGWVSVGIDHDTAEFAAQSIWNWWQQMGKPAYPQATELMVNCDGGGSNGRNNRLWKVELQRLADDTGLVIHVCHYPPGTSKWNKIEHRMFCRISKNWRGQPLTSYEIVVSLIGSTTTTSGLRIRAALDSEQYCRGIKISDEEMAELAMIAHEFHPEWNYRFLPRQPT
jgi:hypothetical protein